MTAKVWRNGENERRGERGVNLPNARERKKLHTISKAKIGGGKRGRRIWEAGHHAAGRMRSTTNGIRRDILQFLAKTAGHGQFRKKTKGRRRKRGLEIGNRFNFIRESKSPSFSLFMHKGSGKGEGQIVHKKKKVVKKGAIERALLLGEPGGDNTTKTTVNIGH